MAFLISTIEGMEKNITDILLNQKSLERIVETKFHDLDIKVTELTTIVNQLKHEFDVLHTPSSRSGDDKDMSLPTTTQFRMQTRSAVVIVPESRLCSLAQALAPPTLARPVSTP
ncbi:hypothetical protein D1007_12118 [Hordeum vulgare]|nr:hypothetical protein D1007_12118 [Hordeum vulgare]